MGEPRETRGTIAPLIKLGAAILLVVGFVAISLIRQKPFTAGADHRKAVGIIIAAGLSLIMYSFLYRDNPLFKTAENLFVGVALGYGAVLTWQQVLKPLVYEPFFEAPSSAALVDALVYRGVPVILGLLLLTRLSRKYGWLSRYSFAAIVGWGSGLAIPIVTKSFIFEQLHSAIAPFQDAITGNAARFSWAWFAGAVFPAAGAFLVMAGTVAVLWYFFFSVEQKGVGRSFSKLGVLFLMVSFGASFGYTVMGRISLLIGRVQFLLFEWLKLSQ